MSLYWIRDVFGLGTPSTDSRRVWVGDPGAKGAGV